MSDEIWIFNGDNSRFPSAVFTKQELAENWIYENKLSGILTQYPVNKSVYEWAIENDFFKPAKEIESESEFIQRFTSASQQHFHYENGDKE